MKSTLGEKGIKPKIKLRLVVIPRATHNHATGERGYNYRDINSTKEKLVELSVLYICLPQIRVKLICKYGNPNLLDHITKLPCARSHIIDISMES